MKPGTTILCPKTGRRGTFIVRTTGGYVCQDKQGRFIVEKLGSKRTKKPKPWKPNLRDGGHVNPLLLTLARRAGLIGEKARVA